MIPLLKELVQSAEKIFDCPYWAYEHLIPIITHKIFEGRDSKLLEWKSNRDGFYVPITKAGWYERGGHVPSSAVLHSIKQDI